MVGILSLIIIVAVSLLVVRIGSVALAMTGLSSDVAAFQAQSAFSGVGFTTAESESIASHPVRRRIVRILMLMGTAGLTSTVATVVITFTQVKDQRDLVPRLVWAVVGLGGLFLLSKLRIFNRALTWVIQKALSAATGLQLQDYEALLQIGEGYSVGQVKVQEGDWLAERTLRQLNLTAEGVIVLGVRRRRGSVFSTPNADSFVRPGDELICYGREEVISLLPKRKRDQAGEMEHEWTIERERLDRSVELAEDQRMLKESSWRKAEESGAGAEPEDTETDKPDAP